MVKIKNVTRFLSTNHSIQQQNAMKNPVGHFHFKKRAHLRATRLAVEKKTFASSQASAKTDGLINYYELNNQHLENWKWMGVFFENETQQAFLISNIDWSWNCFVFYWKIEKKKTLFWEVSITNCKKSNQWNESENGLLWIINTTLPQNIRENHHWWSSFEYFTCSTLLNRMKENRIIASCYVISWTLRTNFNWDMNHN